MKLKKKTKKNLLRAIGLSLCATACYCNMVLMANIDKNPLASYGIWGMSAIGGATMIIMYIISTEK